MSSNPLSRQAIHNGGNIHRRTGDGQNVVNSVSIGIRLLSGMFLIPYRRCLWMVESEVPTHGDSALRGPPLFPFVFMLLGAYMLSLILMFESTG